MTDEAGIAHPVSERGTLFEVAEIQSFNPVRKCGSAGGGGEDGVFATSAD